MSTVGAFGGDGIMKPRRFATVAAPLRGTVILAGWVVAWLAGFGSTAIENTGAVPIDSHRRRRVRGRIAGNRNGQRR
jgi:hypothetical protein